MPSKPKSSPHRTLYVELDPAAFEELDRQAAESGRTRREQVERLIWRGRESGPDPKPAEPAPAAFAPPPEAPKRPRGRPRKTPPE